MTFLRKDKQKNVKEIGVVNVHNKKFTYYKQEDSYNNQMSKKKE